MQIRAIKAKNFKSFIDLELEFPDGNGLFLITGHNEENPRMGANAIGKSSLFSAIVWCLFGMDAKETKASKLLNYNSSEKKYEVTLTTDKFIIYRTWGHKPDKLMIDNEAVDQETLIDRIGLTFEQFLQTMYFRQQGQFFIDLRPSEKLSFLSDVLNLNEWTVFGEWCKNKASNLSVAVAKNDGVVTSVKEKITSLQDQIKQAEDKIASWEEERTKEIGEYEAEKAKLEGNVKPVSDLSELNEIRESTIKTINEHDGWLLKARKTEQGAIDQRTGFKAQLMLVNGQITKLEGKVGKECPECLQEVSEEHIVRVTEGLQEKRERLVQDIKNQDVVIDGARENVEGIEAGLKNCRTTLESIADKIAEAKRESDKQESLKKMIEQVDSMINTLRAKVNPFTEQLEKDKDSIETLTKDLSSLVEAEGKITNELAEYTFWQKYFPLVRLSILEKATKHLELCFAQAFSKFGLASWEVTVSTERELKNESIKKELNVQFFRNGKEVDYSSLSGGEAQRIRWATAEGFSDLILSKCVHEGAGFELLDEPTLALSLEGTEDLLARLKERSKSRQIYIAEHRIKELETFDKVFEICKTKDGISTVQRAATTAFS